MVTTHDWEWFTDTTYENADDWGLLFIDTTSKNADDWGFIIVFFPHALGDKFNGV